MRYGVRLSERPPTKSSRQSQAREAISSRLALLLTNSKCLQESDTHATLVRFLNEIEAFELFERLQLAELSRKSLLFAKQTSLQLLSQ